MIRVLVTMLLLAAAVDAQPGLGLGNPGRGRGQPGRPTIVPGPIFVNPPGRGPGGGGPPVVLPRPGGGPPGPPPGAPVPEPTTWALMTSGALLLGARKRRQMRKAALAGETETVDSPEAG